MNCHQFTSHLTELARRDPMESQVKLECELHQRECDSCRQRRGEVEALQQALAALAAAETAAGPGTAVEARLREAFRAQMAAGRQRRHVRWGVAVAAVALLVAAVTVFRWGHEGRTETATVGPLAPPSASPASPSFLSDILPGPTPLVARSPRRIPVVAAKRPVRPPTPARAEPVPSTAAAVDETEEPEEALTDYLLLNPGQRFQMLDRGQLIRVMVPRSTLGTFGYPINPERAMLPVKADLVVGEDGMARAIRFIR